MEYSNNVTSEFAVEWRWSHNSNYLRYKRNVTKDYWNLYYKTSLLIFATREPVIKVTSYSNEFDIIIITFLFFSWKQHLGSDSTNSRIKKDLLLLLVLVLQIRKKTDWWIGLTAKLVGMEALYIDTEYLTNINMGL